MRKPMPASHSSATHLSKYLVIDLLRLRDCDHWYVIASEAKQSRATRS
jgi:hypothetical protein